MSCNTALLAAPQASKLAACLEILARERHVIQQISITNTGAIVELKDTPSVRKLCGIYRGVISNTTGRHQLRELNIHGVKVRWLTPFLECIKGDRHG